MVPLLVIPMIFLLKNVFLRRKVETNSNSTYLLYTSIPVQQPILTYIPKAQWLIFCKLLSSAGLDSRYCIITFVVLFDGLTYSSFKYRNTNFSKTHT